MAKVKISEAVSIFLDEINGGDAEYRKAYAMGIRGWRELNWGVTGVVKTATICIDSDLTGKLPEDFIKEEKVGVLNINGGISALTRNNNLTNELSCGNDEDYNNEGIVGFTRETIDGYPLRELYGIGSNNNIGEFRIEKESGRILLGMNSCHREIVIEYLGSEEIDGEYCINELAVEALVAYIRYRWHIAKKGATAFDKQFFKQEWIAERDKARYRIKAPMLQDLNQSSRKSTKMGLRS